MTKRIGYWTLAGLVLAACAKNSYSIDTPSENDAGVVDSGAPVHNDGGDVAEASAAPDAADAAEPADAAPHAPCDLTAPFGAPTVLPVGEGGKYSDFTFNAGETVAVMTGVRVNGSDSELFIATRAHRTDPFGLPAPISGLNTLLDDAEPELSPDGLTMYFTRFEFPDAGGEIVTHWRAHRSTVADDFRDPTPAGTLASTTILGLFQMPAGRDYIALFDEVGSELYDIALYDPTADAGAAFDSTPFQLVNTTYYENSPVVTADELTIYLSSNRTTTKTSFDEEFADLYVATRASKTAAFGAATPVKELNGPRFDRTDWVSPDGCRIYFTSERDISVYREFIAEKPPITK